MMPKNHDSQIMAKEIWINVEGQENHVCMCGLYHGWSIYGYNIINMTKMLLSSYMQRFDIELV